jgi:hypothetical protein
VALDNSSRKDIKECIEWRTYTPDGRELQIEQLPSRRWRAVCGGGEPAEAASVLDAIRNAADTGSTAHLLDADAASLERWMVELAGRLEAESGA